MAITSAAIAQNQKVVLCRDYNKDNGMPIDINPDWDIKKDGGSYVYIIYSQDKPIAQTLTLKVDKKNTSGNFIFYDRKSFSVLPTDKKKWAMFDYKFITDGDYRVTVLGKGNIALAKTFTNIAYISETAVTDTTSANTNYYKNSTVVFGESGEKGQIKDEAKVFSLQDGKKTIYCMVSNDKSLDTKSMTIYVYSGIDYKDKAYSETFTIDGLDWDWVKVPIDLTKTGKYVVDLYNDKDVYINSGYFEIN